MRTLRLAGPPYQHGARQIQEALIERGLLAAAAADDQYGPATARAVERGKFLIGYPLQAIHHGHEYAGDQFLAFLTGRRKPPLAYQERAKARGAHLPPVDHDAAARARVVAEYRAMIAAAGLFAYGETRPIPLYLGALRPTRTDCSGSWTLACYRAHVPDPNGLAYTGQGYTGTMLTHLARITRAQALPADLVVWTPPGAGHHVAGFLDPATGLLGSFGSNPIRTVTVTDESAAQARYGATVPVYLRLRTS